jgi:GNAT superfamily N-acetyltransferase
MMKIRPAVLADAPSIAGVHVVTWRAAYRGIVPQAYLDSLVENQFAELWHDGISNERSASIFVAEVDKSLCGFSCGGPIRERISLYDGELYAIYLLPEMQRRGIGTALFSQVADALASQGLRHMLLWTLRENPSTGFYQRLGGEFVAENAQQIGGEMLPTVAYGWRDIATRNWG